MLVNDCVLLGSCPKIPSLRKVFPKNTVYLTQKGSREECLNGKLASITINGNYNSYICSFETSNDLQKLILLNFSLNTYRSKNFCCP